MTEDTRHDDDWSIAIAERAGSRGAPVLRFLFGRAGGHVFLVMRNAQKNVVREIHPTVLYPQAKIKEGDYATLRVVPKWTRWIEYLDTFALLAGQEKLFRKGLAASGLDRHRNILRVIFFDRPQAKRIEGEHLLAHGPAPTIEQAWQDIKNAAETFNQKKIVYSQLGLKGEFNCQTALHDVVASCGYKVDDIPFRLWISGWDRTATVRDAAAQIFSHHRRPRRGI